MDVLSIKDRSFNMGKIKSKNTQPEIKVRLLLRKLGYRYRLNYKNLPGKPDIVLTKYHKLIFVHGCFWHGHDNCSRSIRPNSNTNFWNKKLDENITRDIRNIELLKNKGWDILVIWQCQMKDDINLNRIISDFLRTDNH